MTDCTPKLGICPPPALTAIGFVEGPSGPMGPSGPIGPSGPAGYVGAVGPKGYYGSRGLIGPSGSIGAVGNMGPASPSLIRAYHTGVKWKPSEPYSNGFSQILEYRKLNFGNIVLDDGNYLIHLALQVAWTSGNEGPNSVNGDGWLRLVSEDLSYTDLIQLKFSRVKLGTNRYSFQAVTGYSHQFLAYLRNGRSLQFQAGANFYPIGGQIMIMNTPTYIVNSPGFEDGYNQKTGYGDTFQPVT